MAATALRLRFGGSAVANDYIQGKHKPDNKLQVSDVNDCPVDGGKELHVGVFQVAYIHLDKEGVEKLVGVLLSRLEQM